MAVLTKKFSEFVAGSLDNTNQTVGLSDGLNAIYDKVVTWTTATRPTTPTNGILGYNRDLLKYEFYENVAGVWVQLEDSDDIAVLLALLASHVAGEGASLIGLEDQGAVASKTVQDMAEATLIAQTDNGTLTNGQFLEALATGMLSVTTATGVIASRILTGTTNEIDIANGNGSAAPTFSLSATLDLPGTITVQSSTVIDEIIDDDTMATATDSNLATAESIVAYIGGSGGGPFLPLAGGTMSGVIAMGNNTIDGVPVPVNPDEVATKGYVDGIALNIITACRLATDADLAGYTYDNGALGVGATLTAPGVGVITVDGTAVVLNDRVLIKNQTAPAENGIYYMSTEGTAGVAGVFTRATDWDQSSEMHAGDVVRIVAGTVNVGTVWMMTQTATIVVGTTDITWINVTNSGLGTMSTQDANAVAITGGTIDSTVIGGVTPAAGTFTDLVSDTLDINSTIVLDGFIDDDTFATASATTGATSESIKAYVDNAAPGGLASFNILLMGG